MGCLWRNTMATIRDNVGRVLASYRVGGKTLADSVHYSVGRDEPDRIYCWPIDDTLLKFMLREGWRRDLPVAAELFRGVKLSFREPKFEPSMQVSIHWAGSAADDPVKYFLEIDLDFHNVARDPFGHLGEVLGNAFTRSTTDQDKIAVALDARFQKATDRESAKPTERAIFLERAKKAERAIFPE